MVIASQNRLIEACMKFGRHNKSQGGFCRIFGGLLSGGLLLGGLMSGWLLSGELLSIPLKFDTQDNAMQINHAIIISRNKKKKKDEAQEKDKVVNNLLLRSDISRYNLIHTYLISDLLHIPHSF